MPKRAFTVRVELHGVEEGSDKYTKLHDEMKSEGFVRFMKIDNGKFALPPAEYSRVSEESKMDVLKRAKRAAGRVMSSDDDFSILLTASETARVHHNLTKINN